MRVSPTEAFEDGRAGKVAVWFESAHYGSATAKQEMWGRNDPSTRFARSGQAGSATADSCKRNF